MHLSTYVAFALTFIVSIPTPLKVLAIAGSVYAILQALKNVPGLTTFMSGWVAVAFNVALSGIGALLTIPADQLYTLATLTIVLSAALAAAGIHGTTSKIIAKSARPVDTQKLAVVALCALLTLGTMPVMAGCNAAQVNTVVTDISNYMPTVLNLLQDAITVWSAVGTTNPPSTNTTSGEVAAALGTIKTDLTNLQPVLQDYLTASSASAQQTNWTNIQALMTTLVNDSNSVLNIAAIKDPSTQKQAVIVLTAVNAAVNVLAGWELSALSKSQVKAAAKARTMKLAEVETHWNNQDRARIAAASGRSFEATLNYAEAQGF